VLLHLMRDTGGLRQLALRLRALAEPEEHLMWAALSHVFEAWTDAQEERSERAVERMEYGIRKWQETKAGIAMCDIAVMQAEVLLAAGRESESLAAIQRGYECCERAERFSAPELHRLEGEILAGRGRQAEARTALRQAIASARSLGSRTLELRAALSQDRLFQNASTQGDLESVLHGFNEGLDWPERREAVMRLDSSEPPGDRQAGRIAFVSAAFES
jgi:tetratricopeptide (TPR) repeat protein